MTRAFWDSQFKFSEVIPDFAGYLGRAERESAAFAADHDLHRSAYGSDPRQWAEWTAGTGSDAVLPVIIHGGYWRALRADDHRFMMASLRVQGATIANLEYRLMPGIRLSDVVADVTTGLRSLADRFAKARLLIIGHSAGAHLAISAMSDPRVSGRTCGIIALSGVYDLHPVAQSFLHDELYLTPEEIRDHSLAPDTQRPPALYVTGTAETHEFRRGSALMASLGPSHWHQIDGANHMSLLWAASAAMDNLISTLQSLEDT